MHSYSIRVNIKTILTEGQMNSSLSRHFCYHYLTFSCTWIFFPSLCRLMMPVCLFMFYSLPVEYFTVGRAKIISPTSAISHSYLMTEGSAKNQGKSKNVDSFSHSLWKCVHLCLAQNSTWQKWITRVLKNSQEISKEIYSCLLQSHSLTALLTSAACIDHLQLPVCFLFH